MPTVSDPEIKGQQPEGVDPEVKAPELFAAEIEMEKKSSSILPLMLVAGLVLVVGGTIYYFFKGSKEVLTPQAAIVAVNSILKSQGPAVIRFSTGAVTSSVNEKPMDPHYKLLAKAGIIVTRPRTWSSIFSELTPAGQKLLDSINGVEKSNNSDKTVTYQVPLAERKLTAIENIAMVRPHIARVTYAWQWDPNRLGKEFDASGPLVKSFNTWDRSTLIKSYGVDFYGNAPSKVTVVLMETKDGSWKPYVE
jgi:hypothetical protein